MAKKNNSHELEDKLYQYTKEKLFNGRKAGSLEDALEKALGLKKESEGAPEELTDEHWL